MPFSIAKTCIDVLAQTRNLNKQFIHTNQCHQNDKLTEGLYSIFISQVHTYSPRLNTVPFEYLKILAHV
jgi:hypothetical protein